MTTSWSKTPEASYKFAIDWTDALAGDTIDTSLFTLVTPAGVTIDGQEHTTNKSIVQLSGGTAGLVATISCRITTATSLETLDAETIYLTILSDLIVEDGTGVAGAEVYTSLEAADLYWSKRPQSPFAAKWFAATGGNKQGALREAASYMDAVLSYPGSSATATQGLLCPRKDDCDDAFVPFPAQLVTACIELAARAITSPLAPDQGNTGWVKRVRERVEGVVDTETEYGGAGQQDGQYGAVFRSLSFWLVSTPGETNYWIFGSSAR